MSRVATHNLPNKAPKKLIKDKPLVLVILGPTASGKTSLAVKLASKYQGEIISADSRQVFRGMDIGTGKDLAEYKMNGKKIPYHLIDVVNPNDEFDLAKYQKLANSAIKDILSRVKLPIIVGGTGLYLQALVDGYRLDKNVPDKKKRLKLEAMSVPELYKKLEKIKPDFTHKLNNSDKNNPRRLIRYIEIFSSEKNLGKTRSALKKKPACNFLILGLQQDDDEMRARIMKRIVDRLNNENMIGEVERLLEEGVSAERLNSFGLEYRHINWYLQDKLNYDEMIERLGLATYRFAKRQKTWFRRWEKQGMHINWVKDLVEAEKILKNKII
ncbi:MAG: tRNA (adenosine(37)-N6)-dimethylallyltransferase MiaA [Patescibacteria group bacterium]